MKKIIFIALFLLPNIAQSVTKQKPLKIGSVGMPTEMSPSTDYGAMKGVAFNNSDNTLIDESAGILRFYTNAALVGSIDTSGGWLIPGHIAVGNNASVNTALVGLFTDLQAGSGSLTGVQGNVGTNQNNSSDSYVGGEFLGQVYGSGNAASAVGVSATGYGLSSGTSNGYIAGARLTGTITDPGTYTNLFGADIYASLDNSFGDPTLSGALYGARISVTRSGGTIPTAYGLYLGDFSSAGSTAWSIASNGGNSYFTGNTRLGGSSAPTNALSVTGAADVSTQVTTPIVSGGTGSGNSLTLKSNDTAWPRTTRTQTDFLTIGQDFTYPTGSTGSFNGILFSPAITAIDVASPNVNAIQVAPSYTYTVAQSWGLSPKSGLNFTPTLTSGVGSAGTDSIIFQGINGQPNIDLSSGSRTATNFWGMAADPRMIGTSGTVTTMYGVRSRGSIVSGTTATSFNAFISDYTAASGSTTGTYRGLYIAPTFSGTITTFEGVRIDDQSAPSGNKIGFYQRGTNLHNRFQGAVVIGADSAPTAGIELDLTGDEKISGSLTIGTPLAVSSGGSGSANQQTGAFWSNTGNNGQVDGTSNFLGTTDAIPIRVVAGGTTAGNHKFDVKNAVNNIFDLFPEDFTTSLGGSHSIFYSSHNMTWGGGSSPTWRRDYVTNTHTISGVNLSNFINTEHAPLVTTLGSASNRTISNYQTNYDHATLRGDGKDLAFTNLRSYDDATSTGILNSGTVTVANWDSIISRPSIGSGTSVTTFNGIRSAASLSGNITTAHMIRIDPSASGTVTNWNGLKITPPSGPTNIRAIDVDSGHTVLGGRLTVGTTSPSTLYTAEVQSANASDVVLRLAGAISQSGVYIQVRDSSGNDKFALRNDGEVRMYGSTSGYSGLKAAATTTSVTYTLPSADGSANQVLQTNGSGTLSWVTNPSNKRTFDFTGGDPSIGGSVTTALTVNGASSVGVYVPIAMTCTNITMLLDSNRTAGTATGKWLKDGVVQTGNCSISTATDRCTGTMSVNVAANSVITLQSVSSSFTPTGADVSVYLVCQEQ